VAGKDMENNILTVVQGHDHPLLLSDGLQAQQMHWIAGHDPREHWVYAAKTRYRQPDAPCEIDAINGDSCEIRFGEAQWAVTPGQSVVVYESRVCLGGGIITAPISA
jgi:tRNA-specific 2-thiouridylase